MAARAAGLGGGASSFFRPFFFPFATACEIAVPPGGVLGSDPCVGFGEGELGALTFGTTAPPFTGRGMSPSPLKTHVASSTGSTPRERRDSKAAASSAIFLRGCQPRLSQL